MVTVIVKRNTYGGSEYLQNACNYVLNPEKAIGARGYGVDPYNAGYAYHQMMANKSYFGKTGDNPLLHVIVSFDDSVTDADTARKMTEQCAGYYSSDYQVLYCTHEKERGCSMYHGHRMLIVNPKDDNTYDTVIVDFETNGNEFTTSIPYKDFVRMNLLPYFKEFIKHIGCPTELVNELPFYLINSAPIHHFINIPRYSTWIEIENKQMLFVTKASYIPHIHKYLPQSILNREVRCTLPSPYDVTSFCYIFKEIHWKLKMLIVFRVSSLFLSIISNEMKIEPKQILLLEPSRKCTEDILISLIKNKNYFSYHATSLNADIKDIKSELNNMHNGIALFRDTNLFEYSNKTTSSLQYIYDDLNNTVGEEDYPLHLTTIISQFLSNILPSDNICCISFDDVEINCDMGDVMRKSQELDSIIIETFGTNALSVISTN